MIRKRVDSKPAKREKSPYVRVTSVLSFVDSSWYQYWIKGLAAKCPNPVEEAERITEESAAFGTAVHKIVESYLRNEILSETYTPRQLECAGHIIEWLKQTGAKPWMIEGKPAIEFEVVSDKLGLIGHFDAVLNIGGIPWIADFKTSSKMRKGFPLQKAAYAKMLQLQYGIAVNDGVTIRVDRDPAAEPQFELKEYHELQSKYWPVFKAALDTYSYYNNKNDWAIKKKDKKAK